jgi:Putative beta-barrel porin 2
MKFQHRLLTAAAVTAVAVAPPDARALVSLEDGLDHIFVDGSIEMGYDSNVFANAQSGGSFVYQGSLGAEFTRRAGWIGVNISASVNFAEYSSFRSQDYVDPKVAAEFTKQTGRTTGSLTMSVDKVNRADVDVNTRDVSWIYDVGLNFQYPVIERYSITGSLDYDHVDYLDQLLFTNLTTYTGNLSLYYILNEQRDLFINYRARLTDEENGDSFIDNALSGGVSGRVIGPFNGSVQVGYQERTPHGGPGSDASNDFTASGAVTWNMSRRMTLTGNLAKDFSVTANALSVDTTSAGLTFQDSFTSKASATLESLGGENEFLGDEGLTAPDGGRRIDYFLSLSAAYFYTVNQHLKVSINYTYYRSWSTVAYADFPRSQVNLTLSSHW